MKTVIIAGGGTGGHLFPGVSIAQEIQRRYPRVQIHFVGAQRGIEVKVIPKLGYPLHMLSVSGLYKVGAIKKILGFFRLFGSLIESFKLVRTLKPDVVIGVGGYASGPCLLAALFLGRLTVVQEQNAFPGMTNKFLGKWVSYAYVPFEGMESVFANPVVTGNPIRREISILNDANDDRDENKFHLTVFGGSQGSVVLNKVILDSLPGLQSYKDRVSILHQAGKKDCKMLKKAYAEFGIDAEVREFIDDMADVYAKSHLLFCRAGSSVHEIVVAGRASILVPIPWASGDHQKQNALKLKEAGAAILIEESELTSQAFLENLIPIIEDVELRRKMEANSASLYKGNAAEMIVNHLVENFD